MNAVSRQLLFACVNQSAIKRLEGPCTAGCHPCGAHWISGCSHSTSHTRLPRFLSLLVPHSSIMGCQHLRGVEGVTVHSLGDRGHGQWQYQEDLAERVARAALAARNEVDAKKQHLFPTLVLPAFD